MSLQEQHFYATRLREFSMETFYSRILEVFSLEQKNVLKNVVIRIKKSITEASKLNELILYANKLSY
jgi:hypothetical protein